MRNYILFWSLILSFILSPNVFAAVSQSPSSRKEIHHFPTVKINSIEELPVKIVLVRTIRENWLQIIKEQLGEGEEIDNLLNTIRFVLEQNLANAINDMIVTNQPIAVDVNDINIVETLESSDAAPEFGVFTRSSEFHEIFRNIDCYPADAYGPPPPGMDWCPEESLEDYLLDCSQYSEMCLNVGLLTGGVLGGYGLEGEEPPSEPAFPEWPSLDLGSGFSISGEIWFGDPPGGLIEYHDGKTHMGVAVTLTLAM